MGLDLKVQPYILWWKNIYVYQIILLDNLAGICKNESMQFLSEVFYLQEEAR